MFKINNLNKITNITMLAILLAGTWMAQPKTTKASEEQSQPTSLTLTGTIRDFKGYRNTSNQIDPQGHPDFERKPNTDKNPQGQKFKYGLDRDITTDNLVEGKPEYAGGSYSTTTKSNFDRWYRDVSDVNQSMEYSIELKDDDQDGIYTYSNQSFFPIDNQLFGNQGRNHNFHFTYELHSQFTYQGGEVFNFSGDDDVWVYINGKKVIDIGGVHGKQDAGVNLDDVAADIGLEVGQTYSFDFFFAERHTTESNFIIETTLVLENPSSLSDPSSNNPNTSETDAD